MLDLIYYPDMLLRCVSVPVSVFDWELKDLVEDMCRTMDWHRGQGLAAAQVGIGKSLIVTNVQGNGMRHRYAIANPTLVQHWGEQKEVEGCLSIPGMSATITRYARVEVTGQDIEGQYIKVLADGLLARVLQHEIDHTHGRLFIDHLRPVARAILLSKYKKQQRRRVEQVC